MSNPSTGKIYPSLVEQYGANKVNGALIGLAGLGIVLLTGAPFFGLKSMSLFFVCVCLSFATHFAFRMATGIRVSDCDKGPLYLFIWIPSAVALLASLGMQTWGFVGIWLGLILILCATAIFRKAN